MLSDIKEFGKKHTRKIYENDLTLTQPGSIKYLLWGTQPSRHSISIKYGHVGEQLAIQMISNSKHLELLDCGCHVIDESGKKKDIDLLWASHEQKIIYYREAKGNIEMDTEKIPAMISKINDEVKKYIINKYPDYKIDIGILNWSVYNRDILKNGKSHIKKCEDNDIKVDHMSDFLKYVGLDWPEEDYYSYFKELGDILNGKDH